MALALAPSGLAVDAIEPGKFAYAITTRESFSLRDLAYDLEMHGFMVRQCEKATCRPPKLMLLNNIFKLK